MDEAVRCRLRDTFLTVLDQEDILEGERMALHTTFRAGGPAAFLLSPPDSGCLSRIIRICREEGLPWMILGRGSNLLVSDLGYDGAMISLRKYFDSVEVSEEDCILEAGAGALMSQAALRAAQCGLTGLEFAHGIPGSIGGGIRMNAGAYGGELRQVVLDVTVLEEDGGTLVLTGEEARFGYRTSLFARENKVVLSCRMQLSKGDPDAIWETMRDLARRRREKQPLDLGSAGSTFKRPPGYFAGKLIEDAGLKGYSVGDAGVSEKHAGFVVNKGAASAAQIWQVCLDVQEKVYQDSGVRLEMEVIPVGEF